MTVVKDRRPTVKGHDGQDLPAWLTVRELAELTGLTDRAVRKACATGRLRGWTVHRGSRRDWIVPLLEADAWARSHRPLTVEAVLRVVTKDSDGKGALALRTRAAKVEHVCGQMPLGLVEGPRSR